MKNSKYKHILESNLKLEKKFIEQKTNYNILNEVNTFGFPEGEVDTGKVVRGGVNDNWGGSMERALEVLSLAKDCKGSSDRLVSSQKRSRVKTASNNVSDHYAGNTSAYAVDIPTRGKAGDELFSCIMKKWNNGSHADFKGGRWLNVTVNGYRYQFGWKSDSQHMDHIHVGVKKTGGIVDNDYAQQIKKDSSSSKVSDVVDTETSSSYQDSSSDDKVKLDLDTNTLKSSTSSSSAPVVDVKKILSGLLGGK